MMNELLNSVTGLVNSALSAAGDLAESAGTTAANAVRQVADMYESAYNQYLASGMTPADAADAAEKACRTYLREVYGVHVL